MVVIRVWVNNNPHAIRIAIYESITYGFSRCFRCSDTGIDIPKFGQSNRDRLVGGFSIMPEEKRDLASESA